MVVLAGFTNERWSHLAIILREAGYNPAGADGCDQTINQASSQRPRLVVLGPGLFWEWPVIVKAIRSRSNVPIIAVEPAGQAMVSRIIAFDIGVDDCLPNAFSARELVARIRAILRRQDSRSSQPGSSLSQTSSQWARPN
jgi:DNA-binding response OmpR family regulator